MLKNKCYITAKYLFSINNFLVVDINDRKHILYIGNFKNIDKIVNKIEQAGYLNAICRIRYLYNPCYPEFDSKIDKYFHDYIGLGTRPDLIWLEAIKLTAIISGKLYPIKCSSYYVLEDLHSKLFCYINDSNKVLTAINKDCVITIHGNLEGKTDYLLEVYKIIKVPKELSVLHEQANTLNKPRKFGGFSFH